MKRFLALCVCLLVAAPVSAATRVQVAASDNGTTATNYTTTIASSGSGNLLIACTFHLSGTAPTTTTDNLGQTWATGVTSALIGDSAACYYKENTASGVTTITNHVTANSNTFVLEYSGMVTLSALDKTSQKSNAGVTTWTSNATATTTAANEILVGIIGTGFSPAGLTITSPFTAVSCGDGSCPSGIHTNTADGQDMLVGDNTVSATGAYTATGAMTSNAASSPGMILTFKIAAATGAPTRTLLGVGKLEVDDPR